jgi:hypothetical protein
MRCENLKWINVAHGDFWWLVFVDTLTRSSGVTGGYQRRIFPHSCLHFIIALLLFWGVKAVQHTSRSRSFFTGGTALRYYVVHITANVCVKSQVFQCMTCRFVNGCECFEGVCCLHLQGSLRNVSCTGTFVIWGGTGTAVVEYRRHVLENGSRYQRHCLNFRSRIGLRLYARRCAPVP